MKRISVNNGEMYADHRVIDDYHYIILISPRGVGFKGQKTQKRKRLITVYGSEEFLGIPEHPFEMYDLGHEKIITDSLWGNKNLDKHIDEVLDNSIEQIENSI